MNSESMAEIVAETARLVLRTEAVGDLDRWMEVMNTPAVTQHLGGVQDRSQIEERFAHKAESVAKNGYTFWHLETRDSGSLIGHCGLASIDVEAAGPMLNGSIQIGWSIADSHWRQGFAEEAARAVISLAFGKFGIARLYAQTSEANRASWYMMEKLGMKRAAELDYVDPAYPPEENPTIIYVIDKKDWLA